MSSSALRLVSAALCVPLLVGCVTYEKLKVQLNQAERANEQLIDQYNRLQQRRNAQRSAVAISQADIAGIKDAEVEDGGLSLKAELLFNPSEARLKSEDLPVLDEVATMFKTRYSGQMIIVEVHTDNEPDYNLKFGSQRATNVFKYLNKKHELPQDRVTIVVFGMSKPLNPEGEPEAGLPLEERKKDNRIVFRLSAHHY